MGMKIENLIAEFLYQEKKVTLTEIGTFSLIMDLEGPSHDETEIFPPEGSVSFQYNAHAPIDENLVTFIIQKTGKIRPLALSDLDSFLMLGKQFLNLGKPFALKNIGILLKNNHNQFEFSQDYKIPLNLEPKPALNNSKDPNIGTPHQGIDFSSHSKKKSIKAPFIFISILALSLLCLLLFFVKFTPFDSKPTNGVSNNSMNYQLHDTTSPITSRVDSTTPIITKTETEFQNIVIKTFTDSTKGSLSLKKIALTTSDNNLIFYKDTFSNYRIAVHFQFKLADSTNVLDSLKKIYGKKIFLEKK